MQPRNFIVGNLEFLIFSKDSTKAQHPEVTIDVTSDIPAPYVIAGVEGSGFRILGGGAKVNYNEANGEPGALLTRMYPSASPNVAGAWRGSLWVAASKDHNTPFAHVLTAYVICARIKGGKQIPSEDYNVTWLQSEKKEAHPQQSVTLPRRFTLVGGGAEPGGENQLLVASRPDSGSSWRAMSKDHDGASDPSTITAYAIGLSDRFLIANQVAITRHGPNTSARRAHPYTEETPEGGRVIGGGAEDNYTGAGNMLTASYPSEVEQTLWDVEGKDHNISDPATISAWAIGVTREGHL